MSKIIGLDVGEKRIGVALAEDGLVAPFGVVEVLTSQAAVFEITKICQQENAEQIIIGLPKHSDSFQSDKVHSFAMELAKNVNLPIAYIDETLTSKEAERHLQNSGLDPRSPEYKKEIDKISAQLILEQYVKKN